MEMYARVRRGEHGGGYECPGSGAGVWAAPGHGKEDAEVFDPSWVPAEQAGARRPKLEPYIGVIEGILEEDRVAPKKQRHTAKRIFERLREEHGFRGGYTIVKDYVRGRRLRMREMYVPLSHPPGHAQCDFGQAKAVIGGVERKIHYFVLDQAHSDGCFVKAYPAETTEAFCDGHVSAFTFLGGAPRSILYDNSRLAVAKILGDAVGSVLGCSANWYPTTCSRTGLVVPARGTTRARWRGWWDMLVGTSWCPSLRIGALLMASISVLANRTAIMSHYGECDIEAKELVSEIVP